MDVHEPTGAVAISSVGDPPTDDRPGDLAYSEENRWLLRVLEWKRRFRSF